MCQLPSPSLQLQINQSWCYRNRYWTSGNAGGTVSPRSEYRYLHVMSVQPNAHLQYISNTNSHTQATPAGSSCPDGMWHNFRTLQAQEEEGCGRKKTVVAALKTEDHSYLEAFTKGTNTHNKVGKPLLKTPIPMISCKGWGGPPSESVWSRATTWSGRVPLHHQAHQLIKLISKSSLATWFELQTLPPNSAASQYHAFHTVQRWLCNEISTCAWCRQNRGGWLVPAETDNPVAPDNLCNVGTKLDVAEHVDASRQD